jgi:ribosome-binding factor A
MTIDRLTRVNQLIKQEVAETLLRVVNDPGADLAAMTVTRVQTSSNLRQAKVFISVRGDAARQTTLMNLIQRHRKDVQAALASHVVLKYTPHLSFELDHSIEQGDRVLHLLSELETVDDDHPPEESDDHAPS